MEGVQTGGRRRRENHNEIEKRRREQQRQQLEELKRQIPKIQMERSSTINVLVEATAYIRELRNRVAELEARLGNPSIGRISPSRSFQEPLLYITVPEQPHKMPGEELFDFLTTTNHITSGAISPPSQKRRISKSRLYVEDYTKKRKDSFPGNTDKSPFLRSGSISRRDSALILPTNDPNMFLFGKRDSLNFFSGPLPSMFEDGFKTEMKCAKCQRGVENSIMIDCDRCHTWYHVRCVGIDSSHIPFQWVCPEC